MTSIDPRGPAGGRTGHPRSADRVPARSGRVGAGRPRADLRGADWRQPREVGARGGLSRSSLWDEPARGDAPPRGSQPLRARWDPVPPPRTRVGRKRTRAQRRRSAIGWFVHHYGWRAYALPLLAALTVVAVVGIINSSGSATAQADPSGTAGGAVTVTVDNSSTSTVTVPGPGVTTTVQNPGPGAGPSAVPTDPAAVVAAARIGAALPIAPNIDPGQAFDGVVMGLLPPGQPFAKTGAGTFHVVPGTSKPFGDGPDHRTFTVEVEDGIESASADQQFADTVVAILSSPRSWIGGGQFTLQRIDSGTPDFRLTLTSQMTTRQADFCGWDVPLEASCYNHTLGRVVINDARWVRGAYAYGGDLDSYRVYAINHEVGHALGHQHEPCPANGGLAPVMMQQSWSTSDDDVARLNPGGPVAADGKVCLANPFVYPPQTP